MKKVQVKVLKGTVGHQDGVLIVPKTAKDEAFSMEQERASRLAAQGIVKIVGQEQAPVKKKKQAGAPATEAEPVETEPTEAGHGEEPPKFDAADAVQ